MSKELVLYAAETSKALVSADTFTKPNGPAKKKRKVLDEDEYLEKIEKIIERDFFPDVPKLKAQFAYQTAVENQDHAEIERLKAKFSVKTSRPSTERSVSTFETPIRINTSNTPKDKSSEDTASDVKIPNTTLDKFLAKNTSEDNASFEDIMEEINKRERVKYPWLFHDETGLRNEIIDSLALPSMEKQAIQDQKPLNLLTWPHQNKNTLMYHPDGIALTERERLNVSKTLKSVEHTNTRYTKNPFSETVSAAHVAEAACHQAKLNEGRVGVDGKAITADGPIINGYSMVEMTPTPNPEEIESTPMMTWGEIEGTPFRLDVPDTPTERLVVGAPQFRIPNVPYRDELAFNLADRLASHHRGKKKKAMSKVTDAVKTPVPQMFDETPRTPGTPGERFSTMSSAVQRLTSKLGLGKSADPKLLASYSPSHQRLTPSPRTSRKSYPTPSPSTSLKSTPKSKDPVSLTDNLLNIPKRLNIPKSSDWF